MTQTTESFEVEWANLPNGRMMLNDPAFLVWGEKRLLEHTGMSKEWFQDKNVLDAGCGQGRWSVLMSRLGARVTAFDLAPTAVADIARYGREFPDLKVFSHNVLEPILLPADFDLVWHVGVAHHTGDTRRALENVCGMVKSGGLLATMIYGEPRMDRTDDFEEINTYTDLRRAISHMTFPERLTYIRQRFGDHHAIGWFDAASPKINDLHRFDEIREWLTAWGFRDIELALDNRNLHIRATRSGE